ncbi:MAG: hypothetical protein ACJ79S_05020 [Gemmatimonadaceae bacterium]
MADGILYERSASSGALVRVRRTSGRGDTPVVAVLERLDAVPPGVLATLAPPRALGLLEVMAETELDALLLLEPYARSEAALARLTQARE